MLLLQGEGLVCCATVPALMIRFLLLVAIFLSFRIKEHSTLTLTVVKLLSLKVQSLIDQETEPDLTVGHIHELLPRLKLWASF